MEIILAGTLYRITPRVKNFLFGGISLMVLLSAIILQERTLLMVLGFGGVERWVVYPPHDVDNRVWRILA
jgi:hypothetical protein